MTGSWSMGASPAVAQIRNVTLLGDAGLSDITIAGERIVSVTPAGERPEQPTTAATEVIDADGRWLTSGLWDEHVHFAQWAEQSTRLDLGAATHAGAALDLLAAGLAEIGAGVDVGVGAGGSGSTVGSSPGAAEVVAMRARAASWPDAISREALDAVAGATPLVVIGVDLHSLWLNSAAMRARGMEPQGDGHIIEDDCFALLRELDNRPAHELDVLVERASRSAAARGVVGIVDLEMRWCLDEWARREAAGFDLLRVEAAVYPDQLDRALTAEHRSGDHLTESGRLRVGPLKIITDGSLGTSTAWCCDPYADGSFGRSLVSAPALQELMRRAHSGGLNLAIHAIGDRAGAQVLDAFEALGIGGRIEHAQLLRDEDLDRFAQLGVEASVQPTHLVDDRELTERVWPGRAPRAFPLASLDARGTRLVFGSDAPVAPLDPWEGIHAAVNRARQGDAPWTPSERVPVELALMSSMRGPLVPGRGDIADLVLLDADPLSMPASRLDDMRVSATVVGGRVTHRAL